MVQLEWDKAISAATCLREPGDGKRIIAARCVCLGHLQRALLREDGEILAILQQKEETATISEMSGLWGVDCHSSAMA